MPFIKQEDRKDQYNQLILTLSRVFGAAVKDRIAGHANYILSSAMMLAWKEMGWGYENSRDLKSIIADVTDEFQRRRNEYEALKQREAGDIIDGFEELLINGTKKETITPPKAPKIVNTQGEEV